MMNLNDFSKQIATTVKYYSTIKEFLEVMDCIAMIQTGEFDGLHWCPGKINYEIDTYRWGEKIRQADVFVLNWRADGFIQKQVIDHINSKNSAICYLTKKDGLHMAETHSDGWNKNQHLKELEMFKSLFI